MLALDEENQVRERKEIGDYQIEQSRREKSKEGEEEEEERQEEIFFRAYEPLGKMNMSLWDYVRASDEGDSFDNFSKQGFSKEITLYLL